MPPLTPLRFAPLFRRYLWGGRRLKTLLRKPLGAESDYAESWELVDRGDDQSRVLAGPWQGRTLGDLLAKFPVEILGTDAARWERTFPSGERRVAFPLLFKFLDAQRDLSVQVHPNDEQAARLSPPDLGKTEAWVVLHADAGAKLYAGLKRGFDRAALEREVHRQTTELCLHVVEPRPGDCFFIPAGTIHALGAGLVVAEIQQSSDTTFRLFDWNRLGPDGQPRPLHVRQALEVIDVERGPVAAQLPITLREADPRVERLVDCEKFVLDRWTASSATPLGGDGQPHLIVVLTGELQLSGDPINQPLGVGQVALLPAGISPVATRVAGPSVFLDITLPARVADVAVGDKN